MRLRVVAPGMPWDMSHVPSGTAAIPTGDRVLTAIPRFKQISNAEACTDKHAEENTVQLTGKGNSAVKVKSGKQPAVADDADRARALARWGRIYREMMASGAVKKLVDVDCALSESFESKATGTLLSRASSMTLYVAWASRTGAAAYPISEEVVMDYLRYAAVAAATRGKKFLESLAFVGYHLELKVDLAYTPRTRGIALKGLKRKRDTVRRSPLPVAVVMQWEQDIIEAKNGDVDKKEKVRAVVKGFILWMIHGRLRFGDASKVSMEPSLDVSHGHGYVETAAQFGKYKTGHDARKIGRRMPLVSLAYGITGAPWAAAWLGLRASCGLHAGRDDCMMPEVLADWSFGAGRMKSSACTAFMLTFMRCEGTWGTHSAKATVLSWCGKSGMHKDARKILGHHSEAGDRTMQLYSRDLLAEPLRLLQELYAKIKSKRFNPDETRSGRWACLEDKNEATKEGTDGVDVDGAENKEGDGVQGAESGEAELTGTSSSDSGSGDDEEADEGQAEPEAWDGPLLFNRQRKVLHRHGFEEGRTACGYVLTLARAQLVESPPAGCRWCRHVRCFPIDT